VSVGIISLSGLVGAIFWPLLNDPNRKKTVMRLLLGLATGSLSSSAVFQLLPEVRVLIIHNNICLQNVNIHKSIILINTYSVKSTLCCNNIEQRKNLFIDLSDFEQNNECFGFTMIFRLKYFFVFVLGVSF